jgi:hypothetical protein
MLANQWGLMMRALFLSIIAICSFDYGNANAMLVSDGTYQVYGPFSNDQNGFPNAVRARPRSL